MITPNTRAGRLTEKVMAKVREALPGLPTHEYNRTYEAVLEVLSEELMQIKPPNPETLQGLGFVRLGSTGQAHTPKAPKK